MYDFTLEAGDTLRRNYSGIGSNLIIDSVGSVQLLNGVYRKILFVQGGFYYIESIGGSEGLQFPLERPIGIGSIPICSNENNVTLWIHESSFGNSCLNYVGIGKSKKDNNLKIFPNPCKKYVNINFDKFFQATFKLLDVNGKLMISQDLSSNNSKIDLKTLTNGIYLYLIKDMEGEILKTGKIIKE